MISEFKKYQRSQIAELRPYEEGEELPDTVSISAADRKAGSPKKGDMIARNPKDHGDQWLVAAQYFADNFTPIEGQEKSASVKGNRQKIREAMKKAAAQSADPEQQMQPQQNSEPNPGDRQIPKGHKYDPRALKPLARMLWAMSVSMGHALQAYRTFNRVKSSTVSPDGMLGGRGYVMKVSELRQRLYDAVEALSAISDTIHDEINGPHWKPKIAELEPTEVDAIDRLIGESEEMLDDPAKEVEESAEQVERGGKKSPNWPPTDDEGDETASQIPTGGSQEVVQRTKEASSAFPVTTLPGPRIQHIDRADVDQTGPYGSYNKDEPLDPNDKWRRDEGFPSTWETSDLGPVGASAYPDAFSDDTRTEGFDFGLGYGAKGQGAGGYGTKGPQGQVYAPSSDLPNDPAAPTKDSESDSNPKIELQLQDRAKAAKIVDRLMVQRLGSQDWEPGAKLPNDNGPPVARSDYFDGPKGGNDWNSVRSQAELPGDDENALLQSDRGTTDKGYKLEHMDQPYVEWDYTTHNQKPDGLTDRDLESGPYGR